MGGQNNLKMASQMGGQNNLKMASQMGGQNNLKMASQMGGKKMMYGGKKTRKNNMMGGNKMMYGGARRAIGSHAEVWHGTADHTSGGLKKKDLMKNKHGRIISKRKHALGKKALKNLVKAGFKAKKGTFKLFRK
jgi:hypothetical protein